MDAEVGVGVGGGWLQELLGPHTPVLFTCGTGAEYYTCVTRGTRVSQLPQKTPATLGAMPQNRPPKSNTSSTPSPKKKVDLHCMIWPALRKGGGGKASRVNNRVHSTVFNREGYNLALRCREPTEEKACNLTIQFQKRMSCFLTPVKVKKKQKAKLV